MAARVYRQVCQPRDIQDLQRGRSPGLWLLRYLHHHQCSQVALQERSLRHQFQYLDKGPGDHKRRVRQPVPRNLHPGRNRRHRPQTRQVFALQRVQDRAVALCELRRPRAGRLQRHAAAGRRGRQYLHQRVRDVLHRRADRHRPARVQGPLRRSSQAPGGD